MTELKQRAVQDVLICCVDGLKGVPEAIEAVVPHTWVQTCIVHLIRHSLRFVPDKHRRKVAQDLSRSTPPPTPTRPSQRSRNWMRPETRVGDYPHAIVDGHTGLACVELRDDEKAQTVTDFVEPALVFFATHDTTIVCMARA